MTKSKPATHLYALSLIENVDLLLAAPDAIRELLKHVNQSITPAKAQ
jgi:hypothetical protein